MGERLFGASVRRREDARLVTGRGRYVADVALPGLLHVAVHRSPHAHARVVRIDAEAARRRPGVVRVLVPADVAALGRLPLLVPHSSLIAPACPEILPQEIVSYAGQPVALVVAESAVAAADALDALVVEYEPLPAVVAADDALKSDGPRVHPGGNVAARYTQRVGDPAGALGGAHLVLRERFHLHRGAGMAIETRAIAARWDVDLGQVTVWSTTQAPQILRRLLARSLKLPEHAVRVVTQDIGGGFGPKAIVYAEDILVPYLARALERPVRFVETRREHLLAVTQERDQWHEVELGVARDGRIVALRDSFVHDCGAFVSWGVIVPILTSVTVPGPYRVPNYEVTLTAVYTNRVPVTPVRGAGRPQAVFVMERMLDLAAEGADRLGDGARGRLRLLQGSFDRMPVANESMDVAISSFVIQLVPSRAAGLREIGRVLRPGGRFACITWQAESNPFEPDDAFLTALDELEIDVPPIDHDARPYTSPEAAAAELRRGGFGRVQARIEWLEHRYTPESFLAVLEHWIESDLFEELEPEMRERLHLLTLDKLRRLPADTFVWRRPLISVAGDLR